MARLERADLAQLREDGAQWRVCTGFWQRRRYFPRVPFSPEPFMRTRIAIAAFALLLAAAPATAASLSGMGGAIYGNGFDFKKANLQAVPVKAIEAGGVKVELQRTKLKDIQKVLGGTIQRQGDGADRADWLCYTSDSATTWFISNALGGFEFVMMAATEATSKPAKGCDAAPEKLGVPNYGIPGLGASTADLKATFGNAAVRGSKLSYRADEPGADALGTANNAQYLGYLLKGGKVVGIGVGESSVQLISH